MLKFKNMTIENIGPYAGSQTVDFAGGDGVIIIWGGNGYGKTTLLNLFRYALFGYFQYRHEKVDDILKLVNIEGRKVGKYDIKVILRMSHDDKSYELTRQYTVRNGISVPSKSDDYVPDVFLKADGSILPNAEHELALIMPENVSRFFLFDGELLQEYAELVKSETEVGDTIKKSIESILGVPILTNASSDTESVYNEYRNEWSRSAQANTVTEKYASQIQREIAKKEEQEQERDRLQGLLDEEEEKKAKLEEDAKQKSHLSSLIQEKQHLEEDISTKEAQRSALIQSIVVDTKNIWRYLLGKQTSGMLSKVEAELAVLQEKHKEHESASHLMSYLQHIVTTHHCECCDQDVDEAHIAVLEKRLKEDPGKYGGLTPEEKQHMKSLQVQQASLESMHTSIEISGLKAREDQLADLLVQIDDAKKQLQDTKDNITRYGDIDDLAAADRKNTQELGKCYSKIENYRDGIKKTNDKIKTAETALASLEEKVRKAGISNSDLSLDAKRAALCQAIHQLFTDGIDEYRKKLRNSVEKDATKLFSSIRSDPDYAALKINDNYGLEIVHESGENVPFRSAGYEHIVALSLIGALHNNAPLKGPIIMDSPFGRIDPKHKENIIQALPTMSDQIILLAHEDEINAQTARKILGCSLKKEYHLVKRNSFHTEIEPL
ncbi:MAG: AAA family ATPase [Selenomonadaceae bacterium]|nr:AAA family ATPase [Selenomonadaceae bacterium]